MIGARRELGPDMEPEVIDSFLAQVNRAIDARVDERVASRAGTKPARTTDSGPSAFLALGSIALAIPITAIAAVNGGLLMVIVVWIGIAAVNSPTPAARRAGWRALSSPSRLPRRPGA